MVLNNRGHLRYLNADFDEALEDYSEALKHDATLAEAYYNRGVIYYRIGEPKQIMSLLGNALCVCIKIM